MVELWCTGEFLSSCLVMHQIRSIENESRIVEISARTVHGRYVLRPSRKANDLILGILGRAQAKYDVAIYAFIFMSNHFHLLMQALSVKQMASFVGYLNGNIGKELGELYDWKEKYWGRRYNHDVLDDTEEDQIRRLRYLFVNGCKENLVASPLDWPGVSSAWAQLNGVKTLTGTWYDRSAQYRESLSGRREEFPSTETVHITPLPFLEHETPKQQRVFIGELIKGIEDETKRRHRENGSRPKGEKRILRQDPHSKPSEFHRSPAPAFHAANPEGYRKLRNRRIEKQIAYRRAAERLKRGETDVQFPEDCFPPGLPFVKPKPPT